MPDAYGNLLNIGEFTTGRKVQFISYLGPEFALSFAEDPDDDSTGYPLVALRYLPNDGLQIGWGSSTFTLEARPGNTFRATSTGPDGSTKYLCMVVLEGTDDVIMSYYSGDDAQSRGGDDIMNFTVDMVDGCWFAFNNHDRTLVVDVREGVAEDGTPILGFKWNGGDNQRWRACIVE